MTNIKAVQPTNQQTDKAKIICPRYRYQGHQTLYSILFWPKFLLFMQLFLKILSGMANSVGPEGAV